MKKYFLMWEAMLAGWVIEGNLGLTGGTVVTKIEELHVASWLVTVCKPKCQTVLVQCTLV